MVASIGSATRVGSLRRIRLFIVWVKTVILTLPVGPDSVHIRVQQEEERIGRRYRLGEPPAHSIVGTAVKAALNLRAEYHKFAIEVVGRGWVKQALRGAQHGG